MTILITLLTLVLVINCLFLILLVLIQLPKKEAGAGLAFGAGATDALFGAGSGNALTKLTKYTAFCFLALSLVLGIMNVKNYRSGSSDLKKILATRRPAVPMTAPAAAPSSPFQTLTNLSVMNTPAAATNTAPATNAAAPAPARTTNAAPK